MRRKGYEGCFIHGLGYSIGVEVHENPRFNEICDDRLREGIVITVESGIYSKGRLGVSKVPVREALTKLCREGTLRSVPRFGYIVNRISEKNSRDVIESRVFLETKMLEISFTSLTQENLDRLKVHVIKAAAKQNIDVRKVWEDNKKFHMLLVSFLRTK